MTPTAPPAPGPLSGFTSTNPPSYLGDLGGPPPLPPAAPEVWTVVGQSYDCVTFDVIEAETAGEARRLVRDHRNDEWQWRGTFGGRIHEPVETADFGVLAYTDHREAGR